MNVSLRDDILILAADCASFASRHRVWISCFPAIVSVRMRMRQTLAECLEQSMLLFERSGLGCELWMLANLVDDIAEALEFGVCREDHVYDGEAIGEIVERSIMLDHLFLPVQNGGCGVHSGFLSLSAS